MEIARLPIHHEVFMSESSATLFKTRIGTLSIRFKQMHDALNRNAHLAGAPKQIAGAAKAAGLDLEKFESDRSDPVVVEEVQQDIEQANAHFSRHSNRFTRKTPGSVNETATRRN